MEIRSSEYGEGEFYYLPTQNVNFYWVIDLQLLDYFLLNADKNA